MYRLVWGTARLTVLKEMRHVHNGADDHDIEVYVDFMLKHY